VTQIGQLSGNLYKHVVRVYNKASLVYSDDETFNIDSDIFLEWSNKPIEEPRLSVLRGTVTKEYDEKPFQK
jgi:hypothetical protein